MILNEAGIMHRNNMKSLRKGRDEIGSEKSVSGLNSEVWLRKGRGEVNNENRTKNLKARGEKSFRKDRLGSAIGNKLRNVCLFGTDMAMRR